MSGKIPVFFHEEQLQHKPVFEFIFGDKIPHPETTHRAESILEEIQDNQDLFYIEAPVEFPLHEIKEIHNEKMIKVFQAAVSLPLDKTFYPSVFPYYRDKSSLDPNKIQHAGAFCFDSGTPLNNTTYAAASWSAACAVKAAEAIVEKGQKYSYALCRPPGHHASVDLFGGYCYFNNAALAVKKLQKKYKKIAVIDIDFHHGNGTQVIFDQDPSVLVISLHGDPNEFYPYFSGYECEIGTDKGEGFNLNIPLPRGITYVEYELALKKKVFPALSSFNPDALVVSAGFDTYVSDPIGGFCLETKDYTNIGEFFYQFNLPTVIVQEGGYDANNLGRNVVTFLKGFLS